IQGRFESADGGTIFLDEVGELPLNIQAKLLRVLQNGEVQRLGTDKTRHVNVRIVAATNRKLNEQVKTGEFRADLYHRLSVYPLHIPPLRDRGNDILLLAGFFLEQNRTRLGFRSLRIADSSESLLLNYTWPGNVRELEHVVSRAAIKALSRGVVRSDIVTLTPDCFDGLGTATVSVLPTEVTVSESGKELPNLKHAIEQTQRSLIRQALHRTDQSWAQAARLLGVDASNLHKLASRLGLKAGTPKTTEDA
ncbi:MAG: sigma 54-interacting transcriptional regulator, partial [Firmicutes bacterium]|nr:sigma 54-interacting transcriptional regulator [Bacillota bacterium]